jgi:hypothetical protein
MVSDGALPVSMSMKSTPTTFPLATAICTKSISERFQAK